MRIYTRKESVFVLFFLMLLTPSSAFASKLLDSLVHSFHYGSVKQRIEAANELAWQLRYSSMDSALFYAQWAHNSSEEINDERLKVTSLKRMGIILKNKGSYAKALEKMQEVLEYEKLFKSWKGIASVYNNMGTVYREIGALDEAYRCYISSLNIKEKHYPGSRTLCNTYRNLGYFYGNYRANTDTAAYYFDRAEKIALTLSDKEIIADIANDRGNLYRIKEDNQKAKEYLHRALLGFKEIKYRHRIALVLLNLGLVSTKLEEFSEAEAYLKKCLEIWKSSLDSIGIARANINLGDLMLQKKSYEGAKSHYKISYDISVRLNKADITWKALLGLAESHAGLREYQEAYRAMRDYDAIEDTLYSKEKNKTISLLRERFNTEKKEQEITYLNTIRDQQANALRQSDIIWKSTMAISVLVLIIVGMLAIYYRYRQKVEIREALRKDELNSYRMKALNQQKEMQVMEAAFIAQEEERQRISSMLHGEVGSVLHTFKMYFSSWEEKMEGEREQYAKASELLDRATHEIREVSHTLDAGVVNNLGLSMAMEEMVNGINRAGKLAVTLDMHGIDNGLSSKKEMGIYRIIQEAMGNVIKHSGASKMDISLTKSKDELTIIIEDNGKGFDLVEARKNGGLGLRNIEDRASQMGGEVVFDAMLGRGVTVIIKLNI